MDLAEAVEQLGLRSFKTLSEGFLKRYRGSAMEILRAAERGEIAEARRSLHTLVGVAGNLRLTDVHARALQLQSVLKAEPQSPEGVATAAHALDAALATAA